jgi:transketolase
MKKILLPSKLEFSEKNIQLWAKMGSRAMFGAVLLELAPQLENLLVLTADTSTSAGLDRFRKAYPNKHIELGIAEQNMIAVAASLASEKWLTVATSFSPFVTLRCAEQIKVNVAYMQNPIKIVGLASGVVLGNLGYTHCSIEDVAVIRAIPDITILSPCDVTETIKCVLAMLEWPHPVYLRLTGGAPNEAVDSQDYSFQIGKARVVSELGQDFLILATGTMVKVAQKAALELAQDGINITVINYHTLRPFDFDKISDRLLNYSHVMTLEEHSIDGGLGSIVAEKVADAGIPVKLLRRGIVPQYRSASAYNEILEENHLTVAAVISEIKQIVQKGV